MMCVLLDALLLQHPFRVDSQSVDGRVIIIDLYGWMIQGQSTT